MKKRRRNRKVTPQFFNTLPSEIVIDILSRLSIRSIAICKCVCRPWLDLLRTRDFADFHFSKSILGLVTISYDITLEWEDFNLFEFDDDSPDLRYKPLPEIDSMDPSRSSLLWCSANGLLLMRKRIYRKRHDLFVCNPVTREYIELPYDNLVFSFTTIFAYGLGVSRVTGKHKVVSIYHECSRPDRGLPSLQNVSISICQVYTLGTGMWRTIKPPTPFEGDGYARGVFMNGNIHWLVQVLDGSHIISCFDLETETFTSFSLPSLLSEGFVVGLVVLGDCLCVCDNGVDEIVIWLMKEYGDEKSWTKEFVIRKNPGVVDYNDLDEYQEVVHPIKVLKDGDILMAWQRRYMIYYSNKTKTIKQIEVFGEVVFDDGMEAIPHTLSFCSLSSFVNESVRRF